VNDCYIETNGILLHYLEHGAGDPTLVLTHGLTANAHSFDGLIEAGLADGMRVLSVDLRGRGESDKPESGYTMADHAADLLGLLDELGLDSVMLGGHSFGGLLTYYMAANHPDRVDRCVVIDAPAEVHEGILDQIKPSLDRLEIVLPSWEHYLTVVKGMPYYDGWWDPTIEAFYRADVRNNPDGTVQAKSSPDHIRQAVEGTLTVDWPGVVSTIEQSTLFLRATDSFGPPGAPPIVPEEQGRATIERIRNSRLESIPGNHITFLFGSSARLVVEAITEFVESA
jgi:pimeloyl-ACP methyl ester carboxylesterase